MLASGVASQIVLSVATANLTSGNTQNDLQIIHQLLSNGQVHLGLRALPRARERGRVRRARVRARHACAGRRAR